MVGGETVEHNDKMGRAQFPFFHWASHELFSKEQQTDNRFFLFGFTFLFGDASALVDRNQALISLKN
jgi:hypothetical protein